MDIALIRHGKTAGNAQHRYVGSTDEPLLEEALDALREDQDRYPQADLVVVSPLVRCRQTASALYPDTEQVVVRELAECDFGRFEYHSYEELNGDDAYQRWIDSGGTLAFPGGESREEFQKRTLNGFDQALRAAKERGAKRVSFVVHGGTIMAILDALSSPHREYFSWQASNGHGFLMRLNEEDGGRTLTELSCLPLPAKTGVEDLFVLKQNKKLRCGYTTGSCAAAASAAAVRMLLTQRPCGRVTLVTPKGVTLHLPIERQQIGKGSAMCGVQKDGGDDPDATNGAYVLAEAVAGVLEETSSRSLPFVKEYPEGLSIRLYGGEGVGTVTKAGLEQKMGYPAINRTPRQMVFEAVRAECEQFAYTGVLSLSLSVEDGREIAKKTFNPHLGIEGGISILGTSGIVVPMSEEALLASIRLEMQQQIAQGRRHLLITPGNYGADFVKNGAAFEALDAKHSMKCSNYVGETLDMAVELGAEGILFVAHIGKFVKVSGGIMNTHSAQADCRAELMAAQALRAGATQEVALRVLAANTTEEAVGILEEAGMREAAMQVMLERIRFHLQKRCSGAFPTEVVLFSGEKGYLAQTEGVEDLLRIMREEVDAERGN